MFGFIKKFLDNNEKQLKAVQPIVDEINTFEKKVSKMDIEDMKDRVTGMRKELQPLLKKVPKREKSSIIVRDYTKPLSNSESAVIEKLQTYIPELFAIIREITKRKFSNEKFHRRHYDVQLVAAIILAQGNKLVELRTGEGKTQVFHLPTALYTLTGRGAHVVTVNDYLTRRDGEYAGHILTDIGLTVGVIVPQKSYKFVPDSELAEVKGEEVYKERMEVTIINPGNVRGWNLVECTKQEAYACDVVYGTNNEFGFDYLRDNMVADVKQIVQRELYYCIVDEVDSILVDESRTPLIISAPAEKSNELYNRFAGIVPRLDAEADYTIDEKTRSAVLTDEGIEKVEKMLGVKNLWEDYLLAHHLENALKAYTLFEKNDEYLVKDGQVLIVDQFTGRVLPGRRYSEGLHQAIEAKEGVEIKQESKTLATITFQNFFRLYKVLGGGSGTIMTEAEEFFKIYKLDSIEVPTNKPIIRKDHTDRVYKSQKVKFDAVAAEIKEKNDKGQPVLVGTTSIEKSEYISRILEKTGIKHEVLNAKHHEREAHIVENAGQENAVTIATNMAGRGTDVSLGDGVVDLGGLHVIGTERHEARRIDNQLRGRSGRQGDPGSSRFYVALDDEIMRMQGGDFIKGLMEKTRIPDDMPIESKLISGSIERAQKRMEGYHFDIRNNLVKYDDILTKQREIFYTRRRNLLMLVDTMYNEKHEKERQKAQKELSTRIQTEVHDEINGIVDSHFIEDEKDTRSEMIDDFLDLADDEVILASLINISKDHKDVSLSPKEIENFSPKEHLYAVVTKLKQEEIRTILQALGGEMIRAKQKELGIKEFYQVSKHVTLQAMDQLWTDHLDAMQDLREGIGLRGLAQRDPLVEYKNEAFEYFDGLMTSVRSRFVRRIFKIKRVEEQEIDQNARTNIDQIEDILTGDREMAHAVRNYLQKRQNQQVKEVSDRKQKPKTIVKGQKVGRNDPCPCGSGKKYKKCHGS